MITGVVEVSLVSGKSTLTRLYSVYPIRLMQQETWNNYVHVQMLGFGGGLVSGDAYALHICLYADARLSLRTPGSTKVYKSTNDNTAISRTCACLQHGSILSMLPDANVCCPHMRFKQDVHINMQTGASLVFVDWYSSVGQGGNAPWEGVDLCTEVLVEVCGVPVFIENQRLSDTSHGSVHNKVGNASVFGLMLLVGPATSAMRDRLIVLQQRKTYLQVLDEAAGKCSTADVPCTVSNGQLRAPSMVSVSTLSDTCKIVRFYMHNEEDAYILMHEILKPLNALLPGCNAYADRLSGSNSSSIAADHPVSLLRQHDLLNGTI